MADGLSGITMGSAFDTMRGLEKDRDKKALNARKLGQQDRLLDLKNRELDQQSDKFLREQREAVFKNYDGVLKDAIKSVRDTRVTTEAGKKAVAEHRKVLEMMSAQIARVDRAAAPMMSARLSAFDSAVANLRTEQEQADIEASAAGKKTAAQESEKPPQVQNFINPSTGERTFVDLRADGAKDDLARLKAGGFVEFGLNVQPTDTSQVNLTGETKKSIQDVRGNLRATAASLEELSATAAAFRKTPQAGGILGTIIEKGGGVIEQMPLLKGITKGVTGASPAEVAKVRTQARVTTSQMLSTITQETSRFTDEERRRAEQALQTLEVTASPEQIEAALTTAMDIMHRTETRELDRLRIAGKVDLSTDDGIREMGQILIKNGYTEESAIAAVVRLMDRMGL